MHAVIAIVSHTPAWVFVILAYLVWQGIQSLRPRTQPIRRLLIVPAVFIIMGVSRIALDHSRDFWAVASWVIAALVLLPIAFVTGPRRIVVDRANGEVTRPGSPWPLVRNILVFLLQYGVAVSAALALGERGMLLIVSHIVSGATAGYFLGWAAALILHYRKAEEAVAPA